MPELGEIKTNYELGKKRRCHYQWYACPDCGKESWKQLRYGKVDAPRCKHCAHIGENSPLWKGGMIIDKDTGYVDIRIYPNDFFYPMANKIGYVREHRLVMARYLNRCLLSWETIHHKGTKYPIGSKEDKGDNRIENLELLPSPYKHDSLTRMRTYIKKLEKEIDRLQRREQGS